MAKIFLFILTKFNYISYKSLFCNFFFFQSIICQNLSLSINTVSIEIHQLCIKTEIQERGTECGERGEWRESCIPGNVRKHSGNVGKNSEECRQKFRGMSSNIPGNVPKHSKECRQTFRGML